MTDRMANRKIYHNSKDIYKHLRKERGKKEYIRHYGTPNLRKLTVKEISTLDVSRVYWKTGSKLYKLAHQYYNDPKLWWVIAAFNQKPTDSHYSVGDVGYIPLPLERVLALYEV